ncbi:MAG TPA: BatA domain-containing protein, partial [Gemmataceae bacterium]|nr:BatA domain-containing protein [Gemmataceae bacterium]
MLSLFANPFAMIAGALLISSPIIIHLINRMRFKRIRWAAMEFLLKSQKRSRRKLIIEQMILLALRILMVLLIGLLLARFVGCEKGGTEGHPTFHIILIDDTLSTSDTIRAEDGQVRDVYAEGKRLAADQIAGTAAQATSPQYCTILRLSDLEDPRAIGRLNPTSVDEMRSYLTPYKPSLRHVDLVDGLKKAKTIFDNEKNMEPMLHVVGDLRAIDWSDRNKEGLSQAFEELKTAGVKVHILDCVTPERTPQQKSPLASDNLAIVDFAPDARIVPKNREV